MLKIVLVCGGTGGIAIQRGFSDLYGYNNYQLDVVINAYDNGKSTGICRKVFDRKILGPSDLRKNQLTQFEITYHDEISDAQSPYAKLLALFELRLTEKSYEDYFEKAYALIVQSEFLPQETKDVFLSWLTSFFFEDYCERKWRRTVQTVDFSDFSLSNIFYASCAAQHSNSLAEAGRIMSEILKLNNRVHLISDVNLFLKARTQSGHIIDDEGDIVSWRNLEDRIVEVILETEIGERYLPSVDENGAGEVARLIREADVILFSSGTQWSSLIPTYMHRGFGELIRKTHAKKYLVMNNYEDDDMLGCGADELIDTINHYLPLEDVTVVLNDNAAESMRQISGGFSTIHGNLSVPGAKKHIPQRVVSIIMKNYFGLNGVSTLISDLDGTLWDEKSDERVMTTGIENLSLFRGIILSGNNYEHVYSIVKPYFIHHDGGRVYCDYGNTYFNLNSPKSMPGILFEKYNIEADLLAELERVPDFTGKITLRGKAIVTIKPLENRREKLEKTCCILRKYGNKYRAELAGHTSIDIMRNEFSKAVSLEYILEDRGIHKENVLYLGNELLEGNDVCICKVGVQTQQINDVFVMNVLLKTVYGC